MRFWRKSKILAGFNCWIFPVTSSPQSVRRSRGCAIGSDDRWRQSTGVSAAGHGRVRGPRHREELGRCRGGVARNKSASDADKRHRRRRCIQKPEPTTKPSAQQGSREAYKSYPLGSLDATPGAVTTVLRKQGM